MIKYKKLKNLLIWTCKQKKVGSQLPTATRMAELEEVEPPVPLVLIPCSTCTRTFRPEALAKHSKVCERTLTKKRKKFDSARQRLQGTDVPVFPAATKHKESPLKPLPQSKWRDKPTEAGNVRSSIRKKNSPVKPSDHEQCPHCERFFGPKAYDRHTDWCKEQHIKLKHNNNANSEARERLQVRTKYRAPLANRVLTRDKYLPRSRDPSPMSNRSEVEEIGKMSSPLKRSTSLRSSFRSKSLVNKSPPEVNDTKMKSHQSSISIRSKEVPSREQGQASSSHQAEYSQPRIMENNQNTKRDVSKYDPFASAEQQILELFGRSRAGASKSPEKPDPEVKNSSPEQLPSSAFAIYTPLTTTQRSSSNESVKSDNKENANQDSDGTLSPQSNDRLNNNKNFSLSNLSLCSIISIDSVDCNRNPVGVKTYRVRDEPLQRSHSAIEGKAGRNRVKVNMQQMLYGYDSPDPEIVQPKSSDSGNLEACEAELIVSMMEFEKMLNTSPIPSFSQPAPSVPQLTQSPENKTPDEDQDSKALVPLSIDSAYGSLTRASGQGDTMQVEPSKFCHECGTKYPIAIAKFCVNCGIRRLAI